MVIVLGTCLPITTRVISPSYPIGDCGTLILYTQHAWMETTGGTMNSGRMSDYCEERLDGCPAITIQIRFVTQIRDKLFVRFNAFDNKQSTDMIDGL